MPGKSHGQRSLAGYSPWGRKKSDRTERLEDIHTCIKYKNDREQGETDSAEHQGRLHREGSIFTGFVRRHRSFLCCQGKERLCR